MGLDLCGLRTAQAKKREQALHNHHTAGEEFWSRVSKEKEELTLGATVLVQTQRGPTKGR